MLFLDEPTTGLDPQSRAALWDEVKRLSIDDGVTVFLTTQYLEEADQLANRIGIIDGGKIVAEGTPAALKSEIGRSSVEIATADPARCNEARQILDRFGEEIPAPRDLLGGRLRDGIDALIEIVRAFDSANLELSSLVLHEPTLGDVCLAKTGRSLEGAGSEEASGEMSLPQVAQPQAAAQ